MSINRPDLSLGAESQLTFVMTVCPSLLATKSLTLLVFALSSLLPPMKWSANLCFAA